MQQQRAVYAALQGKMDGPTASFTLQHDTRARLNAASTDTKGHTSDDRHPNADQRDRRSPRRGPLRRQQADAAVRLRRVAGILGGLSVEYRTSTCSRTRLCARASRTTGLADDPQLYVKGEFVGGCDIITEMTPSGEIDQLFEKHGVGFDKAAAEQIRAQNSDRAAPAPTRSACRPGEASP